MTWRGALRSMEAAGRRVEREAQRRQRELKGQQISDQAAYEVAVYKNRIELLTSVQKECGANWDWDDILAQKAPERPMTKADNEDQALENHRTFKPNFFDKLFGRVETKRTALSNGRVDARLERSPKACYQNNQRRIFSLP